MFSVKYLSPVPIFESPQLRVRGVGIRETMPPCLVARPQGTGDCLLMMFHDQVVIGPPQTARVCEPGTIVLWGPQDGHFYGNPEERWSHSWVHCDGVRVEAALAEVRNFCNQPVVLSNPARVSRYLLDLHEELSAPVPPDALIIGNTLENLIRETARSAEGHPLPPVPAPLVNAREIIDARYAEPLDLAALANAAHLSPAHFCTAFRRAFGVTPISYLVQRRMEAAAVLLRDTALDVGEVGRRIGAEDPYHFSKLFKRYFGMPPTEFRRRARASA